MVCVLTRIKVADNCGVRLAQCIKLLVGSLPKKAEPGKLLVVVIKRSDPFKKKLGVGSISRALVVRASLTFFRGCGV